MGAHRHNPFARDTTVVRPSRVKDCLGRELLPGDFIIIPKPMVNTFRILEIAPELSPGAPPNLMRVVISQTNIVHVPADQDVTDFVLLKLAPEPSANGDGGETAQAEPIDRGLVLTDAPPRAPSEDPPQ